LFLVLLKASYWNPVRPQQAETLNIFSTTNMPNSKVVAKLSFLSQATRFKHAPSPPLPQICFFYADSLFMCFK